MKDPAVKTSAAISLGELGVKESLVALRKSLADPNPVAAVVSALVASRGSESVAEALYELAPKTTTRNAFGSRKAAGRAHGSNTQPAIEFLAGLLKRFHSTTAYRRRRASGKSEGRGPANIESALHDEAMMPSEQRSADRSRIIGQRNSRLIKRNQGG